MKFTKETSKRMWRTFLQAAVGYILVNIAFVDVSSGKETVKTALIGLGIASVAAGLAAVMNLTNESEVKDDE